MFSPALVAEALRTTKSEIAGTLGLGKDAFTRASRIRGAQDAGPPAPDARDSQPRRSGDGLVARRLCLVPRRAAPPGSAVRPRIGCCATAEPRTCMPISTGSWPAATPEPPLARCGSRDWSIGRTTRSGPGRLCPEKARGVTAGASTAARGPGALHLALAAHRHSRSAAARPANAASHPLRLRGSMSNPSSIRRRKNPRRAFGVSDSDPHMPRLGKPRCSPARSPRHKPWPTA